MRRSSVIAMASSSAALAVIVLGQGLLAAPVYAQESGNSSAVTVSGTGQFADLKVTVWQTRELTNQVVKVTWTGGTPTPSDGYSKNYLQIFQCWGEDPEGPDRTQCQFGGFTGDV
ncbi:MAG TPA: hypothetical protein DCM51_01680, partial [Actinobacteria bacterium]|nr:hypothetical protein [Actinomycetota bacterium]